MQITIETHSLQEPVHVGPRAVLHALLTRHSTLVSVKQPTVNKSLPLISFILSNLAIVSLFNCNF